MLDFGLTDLVPEEYNTRLGSELVDGDEITGKILIGELERSVTGEREVAQFYLVISSAHDQSKWVCKFRVPHYPETDTLHITVGSAFYTFLDSLHHVVNKTPLNWKENYYLHFPQFQKTVNQSLDTVTVKAVPPVNDDEGRVNLVVTSAGIKPKTTSSSPATIYSLAENDPTILQAYSSLRNKGDRITIKNISFQLKSFRDDGDISEVDYENALSALKRLKPSVDYL
ncbi:hypothetical protein [Methanobacterium sp. BAmetb5]|uniref:hypothetical protein n=1 Tax=Methanobacterium sp. BAmetb5 TaxID=2025351 RepID=UPI000E863752|nr:hypothetical protein [Methanobacterium sp. BAmetb5]AXV39064.1 MAG: hypothetical protein CIT02_01420 [Methanobacterium sp. BAmetb5]